ncbi:acyl-CoA dehydrogenase [Litorimonas taeanensis]|uniref:Acyl-CoA dehydrogenase n=1 Tax=Litorimonas taeanensis TaxID=568099 RepID=A0A420WKX8_9PROT|nr:acyl-CoA dehydrogenase family protein [Litorimonas taeanensis]RKQ71566.1 acyl-CoA dehydrogenase [Litorimonas taeanensis]
MSLLLNDDEKMLSETAEGFFKDKAPVSALRKLRDERDENGYSKSLWSEMAEMGFAGVLVPEEQGGVDMGVKAAGLLAEHMGRNLSATPFFSSSVLSATALKNSGGDLAKSWLEKIASGEAVVALGLDEGPKHNPLATQTRATRSGNGFKISGHKTMVIDAHIADALIIVARTSGEEGDQNGLSLFLVEKDANNLDVERTIMVDSRNAGRLVLNDVEVTADALLGEVDNGIEILKHVLGAGRAVLSAELLGAGSRAFDDTVAYIKERKQFGKIIGEFQALQHRVSHLYSELELCRSAVFGALSAIDAGDESALQYAGMAKSKLGQVAKLAALEGVQMHGGVGMTDEYDIGLFLKRIRVLQELLGDGNYHLNDFAVNQGY